MTPLDDRKLIYVNQWGLEENMSDFVVNIVPADGLAPCGDRTPAFVLTKYKC